MMTELSMHQPMLLYTITTLAVVGLIGNTYALCIFCRLPLRRKTTTPYLICLIFANIASIIMTAIFNLLPAYNINVPLTAISCQTTVYITYVFVCISSWAIVLFTVERYNAVASPMDHFVGRTIVKSCVYCAIMVGISVIYHIWALILVQPQHISQSFNNTNETFEFCSVRDDESYKIAANIFEGLDIIINFFIPMVLVGIVNVNISCKLYAADHIDIRRHIARSDHLQIPEQIPLAPCGPSTAGIEIVTTNTENISAFNRFIEGVLRMVSKVSKVQPTVILMILSVSYLFFNLPYNIIRTVNLIYPIQNDSFLASISRLGILYLFHYSQFVCNFVFYSIGYGNFFLFCRSQSNTSHYRSVYRRSPTGVEIRLSNLAGVDLEGSQTRQITKFGRDAKFESRL